MSILTKEKKITEKPTTLPDLRALPGYVAYETAQGTVTDLQAKLRHAENRLTELVMPGRRNETLTENAHRLLAGQDPLDLPDVQNEVARQQQTIDTIKRAIELAKATVEPAKRAWGKQCIEALTPRNRELAREYCAALCKAVALAQEMQLINGMVENAVDMHLPDIGRNHLGSPYEIKVGGPLHYILTEGLIGNGYAKRDEPWLKAVLG